MIMPRTHPTVRPRFSHCLRAVVLPFVFASTIAMAEDSNLATKATYEQAGLTAPRPKTKPSELRLKIRDRAEIEPKHLSLTNRSVTKNIDEKRDHSTAKTLSSLLFVTALFACFAYWIRRNRGQKNPGIAAEAWEILGHGNLGAKHGVQLVRLGNRLLLLGYSSHAVHTLAEINDPEEVRHLRSICKTNRPQFAARIPDQIMKAFSGSTKKGSEPFDHDSSPVYARSKDA